MSTKKALSPKINLPDGHHAYLILGGDPPVGGGRREVHFNFPIIGINEARGLRERARRASAGEELVVCCEAITEEGQNALLKTLEEPAAGLKFVLLAPSNIQLLPTLLSRFAIIRNPSEPVLDDRDSRVFLQSGPETRLRFIADRLKESEEAEENPKSVALKLLDRLEKYLAQNNKPENADEQMIFALGQIRQGRLYLHDKSGTPKLILEHIALILPSIDKTQ